MSTTELDKDALANLTDEERAAIEDTEYSPEEVAAMKSVVGADDAEEDDDGEGEGDETPTPAAPVVAPVAQETPAAPVVAEEPPAPVAQPKEFTPKYQAKLPDDYDEQVSALKDETRELSEKFKAGEIEFDDYETQLDALNARRDELSEIRVKASIAEDMNSQTVAQRFQFAVENFTAEVARTESIDYRADLEKQADLDAFVKSLANKPENADKDFDWFLIEAHKRVKALHGIASAAPTASVAPTAPAKPSRATPTAAIPATLAQVPGSDGVGDIGGEFADMDNLEGFEYEQAIAKMTPVQRERFLQGK